MCLETIKKERELFSIFYSFIIINFVYKILYLVKLFSISYVSEEKLMKSAWLSPTNQVKITPYL